MTNSDVLVVGAGIIGASIAWRAAAAGASVTLIDPTPGAGATHAAGGMLGAGSEAWFGHDVVLAWCRESLDRWPGFRADLERDADVAVPWCNQGTITVAADPGDVADLQRFARLLAARGIPATRLTGEDAAAREPALTPRIASAWHLDEPAVDPRAAHAALMVAGRAAGVRLVADTVVSVRPGAPASVRLACGDELTADQVVVAAGHASGIDGVPEDALAGLHPVKGQILRLRPGPADATAPALRHVVRGQVSGRFVYVVPYGDGRVAVGATSEDRDDLHVTAGAVHRLLDDALRLVPGLAELSPDDAIARLRPVTDTGAPVVAALDGGLVVATGHGRNGILLAPATADAVAALLSDGALPAWVPGETPRDDERAAAGRDDGTPVRVPAGRAVLTCGPASAGPAPALERGVVVVNGTPMPLPDAATVTALVTRLLPAFDGGRGVAVAVDAEIVPRDRWDVVELRGGENVEVLTAIQGG